jgi:hypothetical protein
LRAGESRLRSDVEPHVRERNATYVVVSPAQLVEILPRPLNLPEPGEDPGPRSRAAPNPLRRRVPWLHFDSRDPPAVGTEDNYIRSAEVGSFNPEEPERDDISVLKLGKEFPITVGRLPDRVGKSDENDVVGREAVDARENGLADRSGMSQDQRSIDLPRVSNNVTLFRPRHNPHFSAPTHVEPLDEVVHEGPSADRQQFLRPGERLQTRCVARCRYDADDRHYPELRRIIKITIAGDGVCTRARGAEHAVGSDEVLPPGDRVG